MPNFNYPYQPQDYPQQAPPQQMMAQQQPQIQNGGFISVRNEEEARCDPVAIGNSVTFKDETAPYVYTKTMGFSQLDRPIFEKYRLVKEGDDRSHDERPKRIPELDSLKADVRKIWDEINEIKGKNPPKRNGES